MALAKTSKVTKDESQLEKVKGKVTVDKPIVIFPFKTLEIKGKSRIQIHSKRVYVITEPLKLGSGKVALCLHNNTAKEIKIIMRANFGQVQAKYAILIMLSLKRSSLGGNEG